MEILIEPIINGKKSGFAIQAKVFSLDLLISNKSQSPSPEFEISKVYFNSAQGQTIVEDFGGKSFLVERLNPGENKKIEIGKTGQFMYGLVIIQANIKPQENPITFFQKNLLPMKFLKFQEITSGKTSFI